MSNMDGYDVDLARNGDVYGKKLQQSRRVPWGIYNGWCASNHCEDLTHWGFGNMDWVPLIKNWQCIPSVRSTVGWSERSPCLFQQTLPHVTKALSQSLQECTSLSLLLFTITKLVFCPDPVAKRKDREPQCPGARTGQDLVPMLCKPF